MPKSKQYKTKDLYEAAALHCKGQNLAGIEIGKKPYTFVFENYDVCRALSLEHINNQLAVLSRDYESSLKLLKSRVNTL